MKRLSYFLRSGLVALKDLSAVLLVFELGGPVEL